MPGVLGFLTGGFAVLVLRDMMGPQLEDLGSEIFDKCYRSAASWVNSGRPVDERSILVYQPIVERGKFKVIRHSVPGRTFNSMILPHNSREILDIVSYVMKSHATNSIPNRYGILLRGPPGNGKSQYVISLATELNVPIYTLTLSSVFLGDESIRARVFSSFPRGSIVLIEDADSIFETKLIANGRLSIDTLLSGIDGSYVPHNIVYILSCNKIEKMPRKLLRRFPHIIDFKLPTTDNSVDFVIKYFSKDYYGEGLTVSQTSKFRSLFENKNKDVNGLQFISFSDLEGCLKRVIHLNRRLRFPRFMKEVEAIEPHSGE